MSATPPPHRAGPRALVAALGLLVVAAAGACATLGIGKDEAGGPDDSEGAAEVGADGDTLARTSSAGAEAPAVGPDATLRDSILAVLRARRAEEEGAPAGGEPETTGARGGGALAEEGPSGPVRIADVDSLRALGPAYTPYDVPPLLLDDGLEGLLRATLLPVVRRHELEPDEWARFWVLVDRDGRVVEHRVHLDSGHGAFDEAAEATVRRLRYRPAFREEEPVPVWVLVRVSLLMGSSR